MIGDPKLVGERNRLTARKAEILRLRQEGVDDARYLEFNKEDRAIDQRLTEIRTSFRRAQKALLTATAAEPQKPKAPRNPKKLNKPTFQFVLRNANGFIDAGFRHRERAERYAQAPSSAGRFTVEDTEASPLDGSVQSALYDVACAAFAYLYADGDDEALTDQLEAATKRLEGLDSAWAATMDQRLRS